MENQQISRQALTRLPLYLNYLHSISDSSSGAAQIAAPVNISATAIAEKLGLNQVQVRKDLSSVSNGGKPKIGYIIEDLIYDIEEALGYHESNVAALVGVGHLGYALLNYKGFEKSGLEIAAAFDCDPSLAGTYVGGAPVFSSDELESTITRLGVRIAILTLPEAVAQGVTDRLVGCGILAIWNFTSAHLTVPKMVLVQNENMATSLASLSRHLSEKLRGKTRQPAENNAETKLNI